MTINLIEASNSSSSDSTQIRQENLQENSATKKFLTIYDHQVLFDATIQETDAAIEDTVIRLLSNKNLIDITSLFTWGKNNFFFLKSFLQPYNNSINVYFRPVILYYIFALLKIII